MAVLLSALLWWSGAASAEVIYIRNQKLPVQQFDGARVVQLEMFRRLLTPEEKRAINPVGDTLEVRNGLGEVRFFPLTPYGELQEWEGVLLWLGYRKRAQAPTGVVDWVNEATGTGLAQTAPWQPPSEEQMALRREASRRRPGYRSAEQNYHKVMEALGRGGTAEQRAWVQRLGQRIADQSPLSELHWTFDIAANPTPNALCTGEGFVVVTEGLLALQLSDDEMAGVLGHEVAHGVRRHALLFEERYTEARRLVGEVRRIEGEAAQAEAEQDHHRLQTLRSRLNAVRPRLQFLADFVKNQQAYNQKEEEEADIEGMKYAAAAGFDPFGEGRALIKLRARSVELFGQAYQEGSRTHPPLKRRLEIQALVQKRWQSERPR